MHWFLLGQGWFVVQVTTLRPKFSRTVQVVHVLLAGRICSSSLNWRPMCKRNRRKSPSHRLGLSTVSVEGQQLRCWKLHLANKIFGWAVVPEVIGWHAILQVGAGESWAELQQGAIHGWNCKFLYPIDSMRIWRGFWRRTDHWYHESHRKETQWAQQRSSTTDASGAAVGARNEHLKSSQKKPRVTFSEPHVLPQRLFKARSWHEWHEHRLTPVLISAGDGWFLSWLRALSEAWHDPGTHSKQQQQACPKVVLSWVLETDWWEMRWHEGQ